MNPSLILNIAAVVISMTALGVSIPIGIRQIGIMRQSNWMPLFIELEQEFRTERFQRAEIYVMKKLREKDAAKGVLELPDDARLAVNLVQGYFGVLGSLIIYGIVNEKQAVASIGYRADQLWRKLEPFIIGERRLRGDDDFACYFEDFVYRVRTHWPPERSYRISIHRLSSLSVEAKRKRLWGCVATSEPAQVRPCNHDAYLRPARPAPRGLDPNGNRSRETRGSRTCRWRGVPGVDRAKAWA
jgi:hypothetical protein